MTYVEPSFNGKISDPTCSVFLLKLKTAIEESPVADKRASAKSGGFPFETGDLAASLGKRIPKSVTIGPVPFSTTAIRIGLTSNRRLDQVVRAETSWRNFDNDSHFSRRSAASLLS
jgi:hypothetical protein